MKQLMLVFFSILTLSSCRKDKKIEYTTDVPNEFFTDILVDYDANLNKTKVYANFIWTPDTYNYLYLILSASSYIKVNGSELIWQPGYSFEYTGKPICNIEFKNHDDTLYYYTVIPVDTAYFVNLPDTISELSNFEYQLNAPILDSNEYSQVCLDGCGGDYGTIYFGTDTIVDYNGGSLMDSSMHSLELQRIKKFPLANFPIGGGYIQYRYRVYESFYYAK